MAKKDKKDWSKPDRYDMVTKVWYEDQYEEIDISKHGDYVRYEDYMALLNEKSPPRHANFADLKKLLKKKIKKIRDYAFSHFEKKDSVNYGYAVSQFQKAETLQQVIYLLEDEGLIDDDFDTDN
jgi:hypothetical protein